MKYIKDFTNFLLENKVYGKNITTTLIKKLGNENLIAIYGLFRNQAPFNTKDITSLKNDDELKQMFKIWYNNTLKKLGVGDIYKYLDAYVENVHLLGDKAKPFSFKDIEHTLIDVVNNNNWLNSDDVYLYSIDKPDPLDIVFENDNLLIVKGFTKDKCIMYGQGYSWCISQTIHNLFTTYRLESGASIYFVLNKQLNKDDNERLCVILRYDDDTYGIADKTNDGNRSGGHEVAVSFIEVEKELPWLKGLKKIFKYKPVSASEKRYEELVNKVYTGDDLGAYIRKICSKLKIDGVPVSPIDFIRDYSTDSKIIYKRQFASLDTEMITQLVEKARYIPIEYIPDNLRVRHAVRCLTMTRLGASLKSYSNDELERVFKNISKFDNQIIKNIMSNIDSSKILEISLLLLKFRGKELSRDNINTIFDWNNGNFVEFTKKGLPYIKTTYLQIANFLQIVEEKGQEELQTQIAKLYLNSVDKIDNEYLKMFYYVPDLTFEILERYLKENNKYDLYDIFRYSNKSDRDKIIDFIIPYVKNNLKGYGIILIQHSYKTFELLKKIYSIIGYDIEFLKNSILTGDNINTINKIYDVVNIVNDNMTQELINSFYDMIDNQDKEKVIKLITYLKEKYGDKFKI